MLLDSSEMRPPCHERHLMASARQQTTKVTTNSACPHHGNPHCSLSPGRPSLSNSAFQLPLPWEREHRSTTRSPLVMSGAPPQRVPMGSTHDHNRSRLAAAESHE